MCLPWAWISTILPWSKSAPHSKAICFVSQTRTKQDKGRISKLLYSTSTLADTYRSPQSWNKTEFNWHGQWAHQRLELTPMRIWDLVLCWYPTAVGFESWNEFLYASVTVAMFSSRSAFCGAMVTQSGAHTENHQIRKHRCRRPFGVNPESRNVQSVTTHHVPKKLVLLTWSRLVKALIDLDGLNSHWNFSGQRKWNLASIPWWLESHSGKPCVWSASEGRILLATLKNEENWIMGLIMLSVKGCYNLIHTCDVLSIWVYKVFNTVTTTPPPL